MRRQYPEVSRFTGGARIHLLTRCGPAYQQGVAPCCLYLPWPIETCWGSRALSHDHVSCTQVLLFEVAFQVTWNFLRLFPTEKQGEPPIILENQAVVDKSVIFMNNVAAVQELAARNEAMWEQVRKPRQAFIKTLHFWGA